jgi:UDP-glucose 4-epimerase
MRVLITGAAGVIGASLAEVLRTSGHDLVLADASTDRSQLDLFDIDSPIIECDVSDSDRVDALFAEHQPDVCVHLAAIVSFPAIASKLRDALDVNAGGTLNVLKASSATGSRRVVLASSKAVYGYAYGAHAEPFFAPYVEEDPYIPGDPYSAMKMIAEVAGQLYVRQHGLEFTALRFGTIVGPGKTKRHGNSSIYTSLIEQALHSATVEIPDDPGKYDDVVYVQDCANALALATQSIRLPNVAYNISSGKLTSIQEFIDRITVRIPGVRFSKGRQQLLSSPTRNYRCLLDISRARSDLKYEPQFDVDAIVEDMIRVISR